MKVKNLLYSALIAIVLLSSLVLLLFYYTQDFDEDFDFSGVIMSEGVDYSWAGDRIEELTAELGVLTLENNGYFEQVYVFPEIVGCINFKSDATPMAIRNIRVYLDYTNNNLQAMSNNPLKIPVGKTTSFKLLGKYSPRSSEMSLVEFENAVESISLYEVSRKEPNPFSSYERDYYNYGNKDCAVLEVQKNPTVTIPIVLSK